MQQIGQEDPDTSSRLLWAFLLIGLILGAWSLLSPPPKAPAERVASPIKNTAPEVPDPGAPASMAPELPPSSPVSATAEEEVVLENESLRLVFSNRGAALKKAEVKRYRDASGGVDDLVSPACAVTKTFPLTLGGDDKRLTDFANTSLFHVERTDASGGSGAVFTLADGQGTSVRKAFSLPARGCELKLQVSCLAGNKPVDPVMLSWGPGFGKLSAKQAKNTYYQQEYVAFSQGGGFEKVTKGKKPSSSSYGEKGPLAWVALSNNYFSAIFSPATPISLIKVRNVELSAEQQKLYPSTTAMVLEVALGSHASLYMLPKEWSELKSMGGNYYRLQDWGWLGPICAILLWAMKGLFQAVKNYGLAVILLTFAIKLLFFPLTHKSMVKMKEMGDRMKKLKPQIDRIKSKYKKMGGGLETRGKMNEEMMALYQKEGINPLSGMGGCLPLLLQMPIFFALFTMLPRAIELRGAPFFGWITDLSVYDPYYITPVLMGVSMVISTLMTSSQLEGPQKAMMWMMPIMFTWFCLWAPAGLTLYWLVNNLLTMAQQGWTNRLVAHRLEEAAKGRKSTPKGQSKKSRG